MSSECTLLLCISSQCTLLEAVASISVSLVLQCIYPSHIDTTCLSKGTKAALKSTFYEMLFLSIRKMDIFRFALPFVMEFLFLLNRIMCVVKYPALWNFSLSIKAIDVFNVALCFRIFNIFHKNIAYFMLSLYHRIPCLATNSMINFWIYFIRVCPHCRAWPLTV